MLTPRGWGLAGAAAVLGLAGRILGVVELVVVAATALTLVAACVAYVRLTSVDLAVSRVLSPSRVHAGAAVRVHLVLENAGGRASPVVALHDPFDRGRRWTRFMVAPLGPGDRLRSAYLLPVKARGVYRVGPLELRLRDPFSLATKSVEAAPAAPLVVYPRVEPIPSVPLGGPGERRAMARPAPVTTVEGDLYGLREYELGDDLRRVHWRSTARLDELMIRQDELPWLGAVTVVLDLRGHVHTAQTLETAITAAASVVDACRRRRLPVRLLATNGADSGLGAGAGHAAAILEHLATAGPTGGPSPGSLLRSLGPGGPRAAVMIISSTALGRAGLDGGARWARPTGAVTYVLVDGQVGGATPGAERPPAPAGTSVVRVRQGQSLAAAWAGAARPAGRGVGP